MLGPCGRACVRACVRACRLECMFVLNDCFILTYSAMPARFMTLFTFVIMSV